MVIIFFVKLPNKGRYFKRDSNARVCWWRCHGNSQSLVRGCIDRTGFVRTMRWAGQYLEFLKNMDIILYEM